MSCLSAPSRPAPTGLAWSSPAAFRHAGATVVALVALTKPRLAFASVLTAMVAYTAVAGEVVDWRAAVTLFATMLSAGGALSFNQWWERRTDALMQRTSGRPLPRGTITPVIALTWSLLLSASGVTAFALCIDRIAAVIALAIIGLYGLIYTPLKRRTRWATEVGAVSGALPPILGAAAAGAPLADVGLLLAGVLLFWQMPHFFAIGWLHREDYRSAGFPLLPAVDATGGRTAGWSLGYTVALATASLLLGAAVGAGAAYFCFAVLGGGVFLRRAVAFRRAPAVTRDLAARRLFIASIVYLPALLAVIVVDWRLRQP